jgi:hypothetical protein
MKIRKQLPAIVVSVGMHLIIMIGLALNQIVTGGVEDLFIIESVEDEDRTIEEVMQELDDPTEIATSINFQAGSASTNIGGSSAASLMKQTKIDHDKVVEEPQIEVNAGIAEIDGLEELGEDLGEGEVTGEVGAIVEGYGAALDRMTQELVRMMRNDKLLVVWLFDESDSMKDDQEDLKLRINRVYEELKIANIKATGDTPKKKQSTSRRKLPDDVLLSIISSFGKTPHLHTPQASSDPAELVAAIDKIKVDDTGTENTCAAMLTVLNEYSAKVTRGRDRRKLVLIVVSDESGDDGMRVEEVRDKARQIKAPIYFMGRESVFGSLYAHVRWVQPQTGHVFHLPIRRGPETPYPESLQFNGFSARHDAHMSGFGPYEQVRLARDTGGIFFQLPHEEQDLNDFQEYQFEALAMREYLPNLDSRRVYSERRDASDFRKAIYEVIQLLNPYKKENKSWLHVPTDGWFNTIPQQSAGPVIKRLERIKLVYQQLGLAKTHLEKVKKLRGKEASLRWRASYDLIYAQLFAYRVRLMQYMIGLRQGQASLAARKAQGKFSHPKANRWNVRHGVAKLLPPTEIDAKVFGVTPDLLETAHKKAQEQLAMVIRTHPKTPWARRAEWEMRRRFGVSFRDWYYKAPSPPKGPSKPRPKPPAPPKL